MPAYTIKTRKPFDFDLSLKYYARSRFEAVDLVSGGNYYRAIPVNERILPAKVHKTRSGNIKFKTSEENLSETDKSVIETHLSHIFRCPYDMGPFYRMAESDKILRELTREYCGLKNLQTVDPYEILVWAILGQQISLPFAYSLKMALVRKYGMTHEYGGVAVYRFPGPEILAESQKDDLRALKISGNKAEYIIGLSKMICDGKIDLDSLPKNDDKSLREILLSIRGVGAWTCEYVMLRSLGRDDACPAGDAGLRRALAIFYGLDKKAGEAKINEFMKRFSPYRGLSTYYLWFALMNHGQKRKTI